MRRIALINMPFAEAESPSIALSLFKPKLRADGFPCDVMYLNLLFADMIGYETYGFITRSNTIFAGERTFAHVLFGDQIIPEEVYYADFLNKQPVTVRQQLHFAKSMAIPFLERCLESIPWQNYDIIGFTSLFEQNIPSLSLAAQIKRLYPDKIIIFGGPNLEEIMGLTLHRCFRFVDYVCSGEADQLFPELVRRLRNGDSIENLPGLIYRKSGQSYYTGDAAVPESLDAIAYPDYDDYFKSLNQSRLSTAVTPYLLIETSRGCWWGEKAQCKFCSLNGKNVKFRGKTTERIIDELTYLALRYNVNFLRVVDNVINPNHFKELLPELKRRELNLQLYIEVRANLKKHQIKLLAECGVKNIQAGIENLSTAVLKLMRKGTTTLQNIQLLKWCKQYGIHADWNIIHGFPGEKPEDYKRQLELAEMLTHLNPPSGFGPLRLDRFSYYYDNAEKSGIINVRPLRSYYYLYPFGSNILSNLVYYFDFDYKTDIDDGGYLEPLRQTVLRWKAKQYPFYVREEHDRTVVYDQRPIARKMRFELDELQACIYECCDRARNIRSIPKWLDKKYQMNVSTTHIKPILDEFVEERLMIREHSNYLSLAIPMVAQSP